MASRLDLQVKLETILGTRHVYYQPPASVRMQYPAIVYSRSYIENRHADDDVYIQSNFYDLIVIDEDPDSEIVKKVSKLPGCRFNRHFTSENLNHDAFTLYY